MQTEVIYKLTKTDFHEVLAERLAEMVNDGAFSRYKGRLISANAVAELHSVHRDTVISYARAGLLPYLKNGSLYKFDAYQALQFNFSELRKIRRL